MVLRQSGGDACKSVLIVAADIGSVARGRFGWWSSDGTGGTEPEELVRQVAMALNEGRRVALGFECPLFLPIADDSAALTRARPGEGNRPWSAGAGAGALATGLVQVAWTLRAIRTRLIRPCAAFLDWERFDEADAGLFLWEAFVSGTGKGQSHVFDARVAVEAFESALPEPALRNVVRCTMPVYSLVGAALLRTGWSDSPAVLSEACLVISPEARPAATASSGSG